MSTSTNPIFSGSSTFSTDFSQVISRAMSIAALPVQQLSNNLNTLSSEQSALSSLSAKFSTLQNDLTAIASAVSTQNYSITYSDSSVATARADNGALPGTYTVHVVNPGSKASASSIATVTDPNAESISSSTVFTLTANGQTYTNIMPPPDQNTLASLVSAINTATQGAVQATIVNVGTPSKPVYQLSIQNTVYGTIPEDLYLDDGTGSGNLLGTPTAADSVEYTINGQPDLTADDPLSSDSRTLMIAPDLSVNVLKAGTTEITVKQSTDGIANALANFVVDYNAASQALAGQRGIHAGVLSGHNIVNTLSHALQSLTNYRASGAVQAMVQLGLKFEDKSGVLSFDPTILRATADKDFDGLIDFIGGPTTGGFLEAATNTLNGLLNSSTGAIPNELNSIAGEITSTNHQITVDQERLNRMQTDLTTRMSAADAAIAVMQQQLTYMQNLFTSMTSNQNQTTLG